MKGTCKSTLLVLHPDAVRWSPCSGWSRKATSRTVSHSHLLQHAPHVLRRLRPTYRSLPTCIGRHSTWHRNPSRVHTSTARPPLAGDTLLQSARWGHTRRHHRSWPLTQREATTTGHATTGHDARRRCTSPRLHAITTLRWHRTRIHLGLHTRRYATSTRIHVAPHLRRHATSWGPTEVCLCESTVRIILNVTTVRLFHFF